jgi:hypothetical protein
MITVNVVKEEFESITFEKFAKNKRVKEIKKWLKEIFNTNKRMQYSPFGDFRNYALASCKLFKIDLI